MNLPTDPQNWLILDRTDSTQTVATNQVQRGDLDPSVVFAHEQVDGRGRFGRPWISPKGDSLSMSLILSEGKDNPKPWLLGMSLACAAARVLHCRLRWPNDLYLEGRKLGGILTEIVEGIPVIGIGVNLNQRSFPDELSNIAISLAMHGTGPYDPVATASRIIAAFNSEAVFSEWNEIAPIWDLFDDTPGKKYKMPDGEEAAALGLGPNGELLCSVQGETRTVLAADAILGP